MPKQTGTKTTKKRTTAGSKKSATKKSATKKSAKKSASAKRDRQQIRTGKYGTSALEGSSASDDAKGLPPAPLEVLSEAETRARLKRIIGAQAGEDPGTITDDSPVLRPNILWTTLRNAVNKHFFDELPVGIGNLANAETVRALAARVKRTRDPQL